MGTRTGLRATVATAVLAVAMVATAIPASADPVFVHVRGTAVFSGGFNNAPNFNVGCFAGEAFGTRPGPADASFVYSHSTLLGMASGTLSLLAHSTGFEWVRLGAVAVVVVDGHDGHGVLAFLPAGSPNLGPVCGSGDRAQTVGTFLLI